MTKQADDKNRLQAVLDELADAAGFVERPHLVIDPISARWSGTTAAANADLNVVRVSPELAQEDIATVRCVLAHELGHLWHRHGKGAIAWSFLYAIGAGIAGIVGWMMWDLRTGAAFLASPWWHDISASRCSVKPTARIGRTTRANARPMPLPNGWLEKRRSTPTAVDIAA